jgi:hypothetical protein
MGTQLMHIGIPTLCEKHAQGLLSATQPKVHMFACFVFLRPVSCLRNVISVAGLTILNCPFISSNIYFLYLIVEHNDKRMLEEWEVRTNECRNIAVP